MGVMAEGTHYTQKETLFQASLLLITGPYKLTLFSIVFCGTVGLPCCRCLGRLWEWSFLKAMRGGDSSPSYSGILYCIVMFNNFLLHKK